MRIQALVFGLGLALLAAPPTAAYLTSLPSYSELSTEADAVVIGVPIERAELPGAAELPGVKQGNQPIPAVEVRTTFRVIAVLRGTKLAVGDSFVFRHYREKTPPRALGLRTGGPNLIDFSVNEPRHYLIFIDQLPGGIFEAVNPVEPGWCVEELSHPVQ